MKSIKYLTLILPMMALQGCSLFNNTPDCNNKQVKESVQKLFASQINPKPMSPMDQMQQRYNKNYDQINVMTQSTIGINLIDIKEINVEELKNKPEKTDSDELMESIVEQLQGAKYICEGTITQDIALDSAQEIKKEFGENADSFIQNNKLIIPVVYAVNHEDGSERFEVQYSVKNPLSLMQAMLITQLSKASDEKVVINDDDDSAVSEAIKE
jgi:hypothetical protein